MMSSLAGARLPGRPPLAVRQLLRSRAPSTRLGRSNTLILALLPGEPHPRKGSPAPPSAAPTSAETADLSFVGTVPGDFEHAAASGSVRGAQLEALEHSYQLPAAQHVAAAAAGPAALPDLQFLQLEELAAFCQSLDTSLQGVTEEIADLTEVEQARIAAAAQEGQLRKGSKSKSRRPKDDGISRTKARVTPASGPFNQKATTLSSRSGRRGTATQAAGGGLASAPLTQMGAPLAERPLGGGGGRQASGRGASTSGIVSAPPTTLSARAGRLRSWGRDSPLADLRGARSQAAAAESRLLMQGLSSGRLLTAEEERRLGGLVQDWLAVQRLQEELEASLGREPSVQELAQRAGKTEAELADVVDLGFQARGHMVGCNMRLVISIARKYVNNGLTLDDLISEGVLGLQRGIEKFDPSKGFKFSTYAHWWIRQAMTRALTGQARVVRLPVHLHEAMSKVRKVEQDLMQKLGRPATSKEVAARMGMSHVKLVAMQKVFRPVTSSESPSPIDNGSTEETNEDVLLDEAEVAPDEQARRHLLVDDLKSVLLTLTDRESGIVKMRFGLDDGHEKTLEEVGYAFNVTRERIRQIEAKAIRKLRNPSRMGMLTHI